MGRARNIDLIAGPDLPEVCDVETQLAHALRTVLEWPTPNGPYHENLYSHPKWLILKAKEALDRFYEDHED